ncbi:tetratricopeptide repeat protein [Pseudorhodobacter turbinis]|nr:tetratricopeptide repeat protein [Pseudorhodobacter turbinis]
MTRLRLFLMLILSCSGLLLAGCQSDEDKAENFYQSGLALYQEGDPERALLELRNVFNHDGFHKDARQTYANILIELGRQQEAYSQYLRLIEQYPDTVDVRVTLAQMAITNNDWQEVERHGNAALRLAPERPDVKALDIALSYRNASVANDAEARSKLANDATKLLEQIRADGQPENAALVRIVIDNLVRSDTPADALPTVNEALERSPEAPDLNMLKAQLLASSGDVAGTGAQLEKMIQMDPDNVDIQKALLNWYLAQNDLDGAEAYMRELSGEVTGPTDKHVGVVQFLQMARGRPAAREELNSLIDANTGTANEDFYRSLLALMDYEDGSTESAIADMRSILSNAEPGAETLKMKTMLARMFIEQGDTAAADTLIAEVLGEDSSNVAALKMRAARVIDQDRSGEAIVDLRTALSQSPQDPEILTLMALAHERDGDTELMGERLALAVEVTNSAVPEAIRYARFLLSQGRMPIAVSVLTDAQRNAPNNVELLLFLADLHLQSRDWPQAQTVAQTLSQIDTPQAQQATTELQARILLGQNRADESMALLQGQLDQGGDDASGSEVARATGLIVQTQIRSGKVDAARATLDEALATHPDNSDLQLLDANLHALMGEVEEAERGYRDLIARFPNNDFPVRILINMLESMGRSADAATVLDDALAKAPEQSNLLFLKAGSLENGGDIDGAIAIYEKLYGLHSSNTLVANNLASLLATHHTDEQSLARAATIVRRLRGTQNAAFQDTYGWIAYRRGNTQEALEYLEPAAAALSTDPLVQYHLGMTYATLGRAEDARAALTNALDRAGDSTLPQFETARQTLIELDQKPTP